MNKKNCKEALDIYKKFLVRMDKVAEFLKTAEVKYLFMQLNPILTNGFSRHYHLSESTFSFRGFKSDVNFSCKFLMKILLANKMCQNVASHLGLFWLL